MLDTAKLKPLGRFWYDKIKQRPYYSLKKIKRGRRKGWVWVTYLKCTDEKGLHLRRRAVPASDIIIIID
jgi:hypothetical protein